MKQFSGVLWILLFFNSQNAFSHGEEFNIKYINRPTGYSIRIFPVSLLYDANFNPLPAGHRAEDKAITGTEINLNMIWSKGTPPPDPGASTATYDTIYYGYYQVDFMSGPDEVAATRFIDFRDGDYRANSPFYTGGGTGHYDFELIWEFAIVDDDTLKKQSVDIYYKWSGSGGTQYTGTSKGIWELRPASVAKTQNQLAFQNFKLTTEGISGSPSYIVSINGANHSLTGNNSRSLGFGFVNPVGVTMTVPNRLGSAPPYSYLTKWDGQTLFSNNYSITFDGNVARTVTATYKQDNRLNVIQGSTAYTNSTGTMIFDPSIPFTDVGPVYAKHWYIKSDADGVWRKLVSGTPNVNIFHSRLTIGPGGSGYPMGYGFSLLCEVEDYPKRIILNSDPMRVNYEAPIGCSITGPTSCIPQFSTATWYSNVSGGAGPYSYVWKKGITVVGYGPTASLQVSGGFRLTLIVTSASGIQSASTYKDISTSGCGGGGGCPFVFIESDTGVVQDNNILNRSEFEDNVGVDIVDRYRLNVKPSLKGGQYRLSIQELNDDHSYFDALRLYAVDHPEETDIGITENNDIVLLYPSYVESVSDARMKDQDLTSAITFKEAFGLRGQKSDTLRLKFKQDSERIRHWSSVRSSHRRDSLAFLAKVGDVGTNALPGPKDEFAFVSDGSSSYSLSGRESSSSLILPIASIPDAMTIVWNRDYTVRDIGLTRVFYDGFIQRELPLAEAVHSHKGRIRRELSDADGKYGELLSGETITLAFNSNAPLRQGYVRDFVLETTGRYTGHQSRTSFRKSESTKSFVPTKFELVGNYPNPFNPTTSIVYDIADRSDVRISIFNSLGQLVREFNEGVRAQGRYTLTWDGKNDAGKQAPSGVYVYQLTAGQFVQTKKMTLVK